MQGVSRTGVWCSWNWLHFLENQPGKRIEFILSCYQRCENWKHFLPQTTTFGQKSQRAMGSSPSPHLSPFVCVLLSALSPFSSLFFCSPLASSLIFLSLHAHSSSSCSLWVSLRDLSSRSIDELPCVISNKCCKQLNVAEGQLRKSEGEAERVETFNLKGLQRNLGE